MFSHPVVATLRDSSRAVPSSVRIPARSRRMILQHSGFAPGSGIASDTSFRLHLPRAGCAAAPRTVQQNTGSLRVQAPGTTCARAHSWRFPETLSTGYLTERSRIITRLDDAPRGKMKGSVGGINIFFHAAWRAPVRRSRTMVGIPRAPASAGRRRHMIMSARFREQPDSPRIASFADDVLQTISKGQK